MLKERKIKPDGSTREYDLAPVARLPYLVIGRYPLPAGAAAGQRIPFGLPPGSCSDGYFWSRRPYVIYRFRGPDGRAIGHRADAVANVRFGSGHVTYRDLALDWWLLPGGEVLEEDRDELVQLLASGRLSLADGAQAERARRAITGRWDAILAELAAIERGHAGLPAGDRSAAAD